MKNLVVIEFKISEHNIKAVHLFVTSKPVTSASIKQLLHQKAKDFENFKNRKTIKSNKELEKLCQQMEEKNLSFDVNRFSIIYVDEYPDFVILDLNEVRVNYENKGYLVTNMRT